jgi:hypothetical protein
MSNRSKDSKENSQFDEPKEVAQFFGQIFDGMEKAAKLYDKLKYGGYLAVVGTIIILFTIGVAFQTDPNSPSSSLLNVDRGEEVLFLITGMLLVLFGGAFLALRNILIYRLDVLKQETSLTRIRLLHERKLIALKMALKEPETETVNEVFNGPEG